MYQGTVKWFNNAKGIGFLTAPNLQEDVFIHHSVIEMEGYRSVKAGESVQFSYFQGDKGLCATRVVRDQSWT